MRENHQKIFDTREFIPVKIQKYMVATRRIIYLIINPQRLNTGVLKYESKSKLGERIR